MLHRVIDIVVRSMISTSFQPAPVAGPAVAAVPLDKRTGRSSMSSSAGLADYATSPGAESRDADVGPAPVEPEWEGQWKILKYL